MSEVISNLSILNMLVFEKIAGDSCGARCLTLGLIAKVINTSISAMVIMVGAQLCGFVMLRPLSRRGTMRDGSRRSREAG